MFLGFGICCLLAYAINLLHTVRFVNFIICGRDLAVTCPGIVADCSNGERLECTVLKEAILSLSGSGSFCLSAWSSLLLSIMILFRALGVGYLGRLTDFCNMQPLSFIEVHISCLLMCFTYLPS